MEDTTKIDKRLRNSFKVVKKDMDDIKRDLNKRLSDIEGLKRGVEEKSKGSTEEKELERLKKDIEEKIRDIKEELRKGGALREELKDISKLKIGLVNLEKGKADKKSFEHVEAELLKLKKEFPEELKRGLEKVKDLVEELDSKKISSEEFNLRVNEIKKDIEEKDHYDELKSVLERLEEGSVDKKNFEEIRESVKRLEKRVVPRSYFLDLNYDVNELKKELTKRENLKKLYSDKIQELTKRIEGIGALQEKIDELENNSKEWIEEVKESVQEIEEKKVGDKSLEKVKQDFINKIIELKNTIKEQSKINSKDGIKELRRELESIEERSITRKELEDKLNFLKDEVKRKFIEISSSLRNIDTKKSDPVRRIELLKKINELELLIRDRVKDIGKIKERIIEFGDYLESYENKLGDIDKINADISTIKGTTVTNEYFEQRAREIEKEALKLRELLESVEKRSFDEKEFSRKIKDFEKKIGDKLREISSLKDDLEITKSEIVTNDYFGKQAKELDKQINELRGIVGDVEQRSISKDELKEKTEEIRKEFAKVQKKTDEVYGSTVTSAYLDQQISRLDAEVNGLREKVETSKEGDIKDADLQMSVGQLNAKIGAVKSDLEKLDNYVPRDEFNNQIGLIKQQADNITKLEKKFRDTVATNTVLYKEIKKLNDSIDEDRRLDINRIKLEKKVRAYKDERVESFRGTLLYVFLGLLSFAVVMYFYMLRSPTTFPGLKGRIFLIGAILIVLLVIIFLPYKKIMPVVEKWGFSLKRRFRVEKKEKVKEETIKPKAKEKVAKQRVEGEGLFKKISKVAGGLFRRKEIKEEAKPIKEKVKKAKVEEAPKFVRKKGVELEYIKKGISFVFQVSLVLFLITLIVKEFKEITFVNMTYFLVFVVVFGVLHSIFPTQREKEAQKPSYFMVALLSLIGAVFIYSKTRQLGWLAWIIAIVSGILIALLSVVFLEEEKEDVNEKKIVNNFFKGDKEKVGKKEFLFKKKGKKVTIIKKK